MKHTFTLEYWQDDGWYVGRLKEVPWVFSQGETVEELEENIKDADKLIRTLDPLLHSQPMNYVIDDNDDDLEDVKPFAHVTDTRAFSKELRN